jgi:hypothetical protein
MLMKNQLSCIGFIFMKMQILTFIFNRLANKTLIVYWKDNKILNISFLLDCCAVLSLPVVAAF